MPRKTATGQHKTLTLIQVDELELAASGCGSKEIARLTGRSVNTVNGSISSAKKKLGARNLPHAVAIAIIAGIVRAHRLDIPVDEQSANH